MLEVKFLESIAAELSLKLEQVKATVQLLQTGATVPFIAHYRKDVTGKLDEKQIEAIAEWNNHFTGVANRRAAILDTLGQQAVLTDELRQVVESCMDKISLEDVYLPYKPKRRTKATAAEEQGLAPLADFILKQLPGLQTLDEFVMAFVKPENSISSPEEALDGVRYILAERIVVDAAARKLVRSRMHEEGTLTARATKNAEGKKTKFESYYNFSEPLSKIPSHRMLAVLRGVKEGLLRIDVTFDDEKMMNELVALYLKEPGSVFDALIRGSVQEAYTRHLRPAIENDLMDALRKKADDDAINVFRQNAQNLLLSPPAGAVGVIGLSPLGKAGYVMAMVDGAGVFVEHQTLDTLQTSEENDQALLSFLQKHGTYRVAISSNAGANEAAKFVKAVLLKVKRPDAFAVIINSTPAASYAISRFGKEEFPELEPPVREAISIARRVQDPLKELIKAEPRTVGAGQYQHDVNQKQLREGLARTISACVNRVGVDVNTATAAMLRYVSGIQPTTAQNIVDTRQKLNGFTKRDQLLEVDGIGPKVFEQCAGFLRVSGSENLLDQTTIHPDCYPFVEKLAQTAGLEIGQLVRNREAISKLNFEEISQQDGHLGALTLADIRNELLHPARDPRGVFRAPKLAEGITSLDDLSESMEVEGVVTNVTDFGAFVDIGAQQDGLVHLSEMSNRFVKDPRDIVKVGDVVRVKVIKVDKAAPRISLSIKALQPPPRPARRTPQIAEGAVAQDGEAQANLEHPARPRREFTRDRARTENGDGARHPRRDAKPVRERKEFADKERSERPSQERRDRREHIQKVPAKQPETKERINTLLADQLANLRDKLKT